MSANPRLAQWLIAHRPAIEEKLIARLGPAAPKASGPEAETLRRFRTFSATALTRGEAPDPALDGLRPNERRVVALLAAWVQAACELAGPDAENVRKELTPLTARFGLALRTRSTGRESKGKPRVARRAVSAAIDRVADVFLAVDAAEGIIADANPSAGALLKLERDALLGLDFFSVVPEHQRENWWTELDATAEGAESRPLHASLQDISGQEVPMEGTVTPYATRSRTLALFLLRPAEKIRSHVVDTEGRVDARPDLSSS